MSLDVHNQLRLMFVVGILLAIICFHSNQVTRAAKTHRLVQEKTKPSDSKKQFGDEEEEQRKRELYGPGFYNHSRCLYVYMSGGEFNMTTVDNDVTQEILDIKSLTYDSNKTYCLNEDNMARLTFSFEFNAANKIKSITISMRIHSNPVEGLWSIIQSNLTVSRGGNKRKLFSLRMDELYDNLYIGSDFSYSCNELELETFRKGKPEPSENGTETKSGPHGKIILRNFQLQPFSESSHHVFNESFDCSSWLTIPTLLGLIFFLLMVGLGVGPIYWLATTEPGDFKYVKEAQAFTQSQMESSKHNSSNN